MNKNQRNAQPQQQNMQVQQPGQSQMSGQPSRDPNTGKFVKRNQQDNQPQTQQRESDVDPDEWLREFYKNPVQAVQKISNMNQQQQQEIKQNMNQEQKQDFREQQNKVQEQKRRAYRQNLQQKQQQHFTAKKRELEQKYGDDFSNPETKKAILDYVREHPIYLNPNIFPDGIDIAYREAKKEINNNNSNNKPVPENNEEIINQKKAAGLPKSQGSKVMTNQNDNSNEELINRLFKKKGGLFNK